MIMVDEDKAMAAAPPAYEQVAQVQDGAPVSFSSPSPRTSLPSNGVGSIEHYSRPYLTVIQDHTLAQTPSGSSSQALTPSTQLGSESLVQSPNGDYTLSYNMPPLPVPQPQQQQQMSLGAEYQQKREWST